MFGVLALLFQPIYKIALGRIVWNIVDVVVAVFFIVLFFMEMRQMKKRQVKKRPTPPPVKLIQLRRQ